MSNRNSSSRSTVHTSTEARSATSHRSPGQPAGPHLHSRHDEPKPLYSAANLAGAAIGRSPDLLEAYELMQDGKPLPSIQERTISTAEEKKVAQRLGLLRSKTADTYARAGHRAEGTGEKIMAVLKAASIKKKEIGFSEPAAMKGTFEAIASAVRREAPINLILPLGGGKVANPLKTGDAYLPDLSEHGGAVMLAAIADAVAEVYTPGAHVFQLPDAGLHTDDLGMSGTEHQLHLRKMQEDLRSLGIDDQVSMVDSVANIPEEWAREVQDQAATTRDLAANDPIIAADIEGQVQSLRYSMNLRVLGWSYEDIVVAMTALEFPDRPELPGEAKERALTLLTRTREVALRYAGTNRALRSLDLPARVMQRLTGAPDYVRLTVHAKRGEPRPALVPSSGLARPGLLPMHRLGVRAHPVLRDHPAGLDPDCRFGAGDISWYSRPMTGHTHHTIDYIEFSVTEMEQAQRFYGAAFGWTFNEYGPGYAGIVRGDGEMGGMAVVDAVVTGGPLVVLYSSDLQSTLAKVIEAGGRISKELFDFPGGRRFHFVDPSGNELAAWTLAER